MPNQFYCQDCGAATNCTSSIPKFCGSCGASFNNNIVFQPKTKTSKANLSQPIFLHNNDEEETSVIPHIEKLEYTIKQERTPKIVRIKDLTGEPIDTGRVGPINLKAKRPKIDKAAFMADAASRPRNNPIEIN